MPQKLLNVEVKRLVKMCIDQEAMGSMADCIINTSCSGAVDGWMICDITSFSTVFSVISGRLVDDNERQCAMEPRLRLRTFRL